MSNLSDCMKNAKSAEIQAKCIETFSVEPAAKERGADREPAPVRATQTREQALAAHEACSNAQFNLDTYKKDHAGTNGIGEFFGNVGGRIKETGEIAIERASGVSRRRYQPMKTESFTKEEDAEIHKLELARDAACLEERPRQTGKRR